MLLEGICTAAQLSERYVVDDKVRAGTSDIYSFIVAIEDKFKGEMAVPFVSQAVVVDDAIEIRSGHVIPPVRRGMALFDKNVVYIAARSADREVLIGKLFETHVIVKEKSESFDFRPQLVSVMSIVTRMN